MSKPLQLKWDKPSNSRLFHVFDLEARSICRKWLILTKIEAEPMEELARPGGDECKACRKALDAQLLKHGFKADHREEDSNA